VVETLGSGADLVAKLVLLTLESLELEQADATSVEVVKVDASKVDTLDTLLELLELLLGLLPLDLLALLLDATLLAVLGLLGKTLSLGGLELLLACLTLVLLLACLSSLGGGEAVLLLLDLLAAGEKLLTLLLEASLGTLESGNLGLLAVLVKSGVNVLGSDVQSLRKTRQLRANNLGRGALQTLDGTIRSLGRASGRAGRIICSTLLNASNTLGL